MLYRYFTQLFSCENINWSKFFIGISVLLICLNIAKISFLDPGHISNRFILKKREAVSVKGQTITRKTVKRLLKEFVDLNAEFLECERCLIFSEEARGRKIVHCEECDICVEGFDHHCGVLGNCIAKYNLRNFNFLAWSVVISVVVTYGSLFLALACCGSKAFDNQADANINN